ncbi:MAG: hypothetical protein HRT73_12035 [Flavobacteriales bacterium]|nr:hypothetical protein [Flavobacteriales bacterium]
MKNLKYNSILGTLLLSLLITTNSCSKLDDPAKSIDTDTIVRLELVDSSSTSLGNKIPADSNSYILIKGIIGDQASPNQQIVFNTSHGYLSLPGEPVNAQSSKNITVLAAYRDVMIVLHTDDIPQNEVLVTATLNNFTNTMLVEFTNAYPDQLNITPTLSNITTTDTVNVTLDAIRSSGKVSKGLVYNVRNLNPDSISLNIPSFSVFNNGKGSFSILNPLNKSGTIEVEVSTLNSQLDSLKKMVTIVYN